MIERDSKIWTREKAHGEAGSLTGQAIRARDVEKRNRMSKMERYGPERTILIVERAG